MKRQVEGETERQMDEEIGHEETERQRGREMKRQSIKAFQSMRKKRD